MAQWSTDSWPRCWRLLDQIWTSDVTTTGHQRNTWKLKHIPKNTATAAAGIICGSTAQRKATNFSSCPNVFINNGNIFIFSNFHPLVFCKDHMSTMCLKKHPLPFYFLINLVRNISIIFGTWHPKETWHHKVINLLTSHINCLPYYLGKCNKSDFLKIPIKQLTSRKISNHSHKFIVLKQWKSHWLAYITASVQSAQTEPWNLYMPLLQSAHPHSAAGMQSERYCCNSGWMRSLWTLTLAKTSKMP